jgi:dipeptidase E
MERHIVAFGGGGFWMGESGLLDDFLLSLSSAARPKVCFIGTASGDSESYVRRFYQEFGKRTCSPSHFPLFSTPPRPARAHLLDQDIVYVGGGATANMLVLWRFHGLDVLLREAWDAGTIMAGPSAGAICWFEDGVTRSLGDESGPLGDGLGLVSGSFCPHYGDDEARTAAYRRLVADGFLPGIGAAGDVAVHIVGGNVSEVVTTRPGATAFRVEKRDGEAVDTPFEARLLR